MLRATVMLSFFRKADVDDPEAYLAAVAATLSRYQIEVIDYVTGVENGLAARQVWLPSVAEVKQACEEQQTRQTKIHERQAREARQITERKADAARGTRLTAEELRERHGPNYGITQQSEEEVTTAKARRREYLTRGNKFCFDQEYRQVGLDPPEGENAMSLALRLKMGWHIEEGPDGKNVLIAPAKHREDVA